MKTTKPTIGRRSISRLLYLFVVTASAIALTLTLLTPNSPPLSPAMYWAIFVGAWVSVFLAWRRHRPYLRKWIWFQRHASLLVFIGKFLVVTTIIVAPVVGYVSLVATVDAARYKRQHCFALQAAIQNQNLAYVEELLRFADSRELLAMRSGWDQEMRAKIVNPLELAVTTDNLAIVAALLDQGASACSNDGYDSSPQYAHEPLPIATAHGNVPMMRLLLDHGATVNDGDGNSGVLWLAVNANKKEAVAFLLSQGANPNSYCANATKADWSALRLARSRGQAGDAIAQLLLHAGAKEEKVSRE